ncbi:MAG: hypothetical protein KatS3mg119_0580 [Rhodothalassiaceae bacterium]|nr:MAG: hypothetical protein KatS3mg119_0580 [Rhodothalassiaceae bacterium]
MTPPSRPRWRSLVGMLGLVAGLAVYAMLVIQIGHRLVGASVLWQTLFYLAAGLAWLLPARALIRWMGR